MALVRVLKTATATLTRTLYVDETATDSSTNVSVAVTRLDGTAVSSGIATDLDGTGIYGYTLAGQANLDILNVTWTATIAGNTVTLHDTVEIVGGFFFGLAAVRTEMNLSAAVFPAATIADARLEVEQECERLCRQAFVPRFHRETLSGTNTCRLAVAVSMLRTVRAVTVDGTVWSPADVADIGISDHGALTRPGNAPWPAGFQNVVVEVEHGWDQPPEGVRSAAMLRLRSLLGRPKSGVPDRTASFTTPDGGVHRLTLPGMESTGIPEVDAAYQRYARHRRTVIA